MSKVAKRGVKYLFNIDVVVFTSHRETMPLTLLEAMAMKKPIIAVNIPSYISILEDNSGLLVDRKDLSQAILSLSNSPDLCKKLAKNAGELVRKKYDIINTINATNNLYRNVIEK